MAAQGLFCEPKDLSQSLEDANTSISHGFESGVGFGIQNVVENRRGNAIAQVSFVVLDHHRDARRIDVECREIVVEVLHALFVGLKAVRAAVGDEHDPIDTLKYLHPAVVVVDLPRNRVELKPQSLVFDLAHIHRQQIEEERPVARRFQREHSPALCDCDGVVDDLEVGCFSAVPRAVVDDLPRDLPRRRVDDCHGAT